jgi:hypothetical protein
MLRSKLHSGIPEAMDTSQSIGEAIKRIGGGKPTAAKRELVAQGLASKWEGTQSIAIQALAAWGDRQSVDQIRMFLEGAFARKSGWAVRGVAVRALAGVVGPQDADWISELCRSRSSGLERHELRQLVARVTAVNR